MPATMRGAADAAAPKASASAKLTAAKPLPVVEPPTAESVHRELARVFEQWSNRETREALYADDFERSHFLEGDGVPAKPDRDLWFAKVLAPVRVRGLASVGCWMEPGSHQDWLEKNQCRVSFWYDRPTSEAALPYDSGSWQLTLQRAAGGTWNVIKDRMTSRTRFDFASTSPPLFSCDATKLGTRLVVRWSAVELRSGSRVLFTLKDEKDVERVVDLDTRAAHCSEATPAAGAVLAVHCDTIELAVTTKAGAMIVKRTPREESLADDVRVDLAPGAKVVAK